MAVQVEGEVLASRDGHIWVQLDPQVSENPYPFNMYAEAGKQQRSDQGPVLKVASKEVLASGDKVTLEARRPSQSFSALILLFLPLALTLGGLALGMALSSWVPGPDYLAPLILTVVGAAISFALVRSTNRRLKTDDEFQPRVIKVHRKAPASLAPGHYVSFEIEPIEPSMGWKTVLQEVEGLVGVNGAVRSWDNRQIFIAHNPEVIKTSRLRELLLYLGVQLREVAV